MFMTGMVSHVWILPEVCPYFRVARGIDSTPLFIGVRANKINPPQMLFRAATADVFN
jgi:hypothetical protein